MKNIRVVKLGDEVEFDLIYQTGKRERIKLTIVDSSPSDLDVGLLSHNSPIARNIIGEEPGSVIPYFTDEIVGIHIISFTQKSFQSFPDTNNRRKEKLVNTLKQIEFREALLFASSTDTKWGSYDPDGLTYEAWADNISKTDEDKQT